MHWPRNGGTEDEENAPSGIKGQNPTGGFGEQRSPKAQALFTALFSNKVSFLNELFKISTQNTICLHPQK